MNENEKMKTHPYKPLTIGLTLKQQIEKKMSCLAMALEPMSIGDRKSLDDFEQDVLGLVADYVTILRKQLEELVMSEKKLAEFKNHPDVRTRNLYHFWRGYNSMLEKLLEDSK